MEKKTKETLIGIAKVAGVLGGCAGTAYFLGSDNKKVAGARDNFAKFFGSIIGYAGKVALNSNISCQDGKWNIDIPAKKNEPKVPEKFRDVIDPEKWSRMDYSQRKDYMNMLDMKMEHEIRMKYLEVEKAKADMITNQVHIETVKEEPAPDVC